jgi:CTP synthase
MEEKGMRFAGTTIEGRLVEIIEIPDHPFFLATQFHPEFKSRPTRPHPLFRGFVGAALQRAAARAGAAVPTAVETPSQTATQPAGA